MSAFDPKQTLLFPKLSSADRVSTKTLVSIATAILRLTASALPL